MIAAIQHNQGPPLFDRHPDDRLVYVQWHIRDFLQGVRGMKADQIGIYTIVLLLIYDSMGMLRDDDKFVAGHCQIDVRTYRKIREQLIAIGKVYEADGYLYNNRAQAEIAKFCESAKKRREAAAAREEKKRQEAAKRAADEKLNEHNLRTVGAQLAQGVRTACTNLAQTAHTPRSENSENINKNNGAQTTAAPDASIYKEREREKERDLREERKTQQPSRPRLSWSDVEFKNFVQKLETEAGDAMGNPANSAALLNWSPIMAWLEAGADPDWDIVPAVRMVAAQVRAKGTQKIRSWEYFNTAVADCKLRRAKGLPAVEVRTKPGQKPPTDRYGGLSQAQRDKIEKAKAEALAREGGHA
jgi:uncharacterized protein YdaU (DUF1376 family)